MHGNKLGGVTIVFFFFLRERAIDNIRGKIHGEPSRAFLDGTVSSPDVTEKGYTRECNNFVARRYTTDTRSVSFVARTMSRHRMKTQRELASRRVEVKERPFKVLGDFYAAGSRNGCV